MGEFELIDAIVSALGDSARARHVLIGPGDDAAVVSMPRDTDAVASIDTLVEGVHFPSNADPVDVGYRALAVSLSDLAAMGALPTHVLVALTLPTPERTWVESLARGMAEAASSYRAPIVGGNLTRGPLAISVSVHGAVPRGAALARAGAKAGDHVLVSGALGASAAVVHAGFNSATPSLVRRYYRPPNRCDLAYRERVSINAAIDISDGLVADAGHLARASGVQLALEKALIPVFADASLDNALFGSDDYELLLTSKRELPGCVRIGMVLPGDGVTLDGESVDGGYDHFR